VATLARANSSLVNLDFRQCLRPYDIVDYDGTAEGQPGVVGGLEFDSITSIENT
jgi:hypothetical protein